MRTMIHAAIAAVGAVTVCSAPASAGLIRYTFGGTVTELEGTTPDRWSDVAIGQPYTVEVVIDTEAPDQDLSGTIGRYAAQSYVVTIGDAFDDSWPAPQVWVFDSSDDFFFATTEYYDDQDTLWRASVNLGDSTGAVWGDDSLPLDIPLGAFDQRDFELDRLTEFGPGPMAEPWSLTATVETVSIRPVPGPGASVLLLTVIARRRRR